MRMPTSATTALAILIAAAPVRSAGAQTAAAMPADSTAIAEGVRQLRQHAGSWSVVTEFLNPDGSIARTASGRYVFEWVIADRLLQGKSEIPSLGTASGILFYLAPSRGAIEMVSVGADGMLWTMTGPIAGETRTTQPFRTQSGADARLRFTRYNISADSFESRMEYSEDGGKTWTPGNHQTFRRAGD